MASITPPAWPASSGVGITPLPPLDAIDASVSRPIIAILSMGEMGLGIASLLTAYSYPIITNLTSRSENTRARALKAGAQDLPFETLLSRASIFLSILPPSEALPLAERTANAMKLVSREEKDKMVYIDLNAISPSLSRKMGRIIQEAGIIYIDGSILSYPPRPRPDGTWFRPSIPLSGPPLELPNSQFTNELASLLNLNHVSPNIGAASGLKMCFSGINKGLIALNIQAYTTASNLGVLEGLRGYMGDYFPAIKEFGEGALISCQGKAFRWVREMEEIEGCFLEEGGWERGVFGGAAGTFRVVEGGEVKKGVEEMVEEVCGVLKRGRRKSC